MTTPVNQQDESYSYQTPRLPAYPREGQATPDAAGEAFDKQAWSALYMSVHNLRVDIQQNPIVSARSENKLQREFMGAALPAIRAAANTLVTERVKETLLNLRDEAWVEYQKSLLAEDETDGEGNFGHFLSKAVSHYLAAIEAKEKGDHNG